MVSAISSPTSTMIICCTSVQVIALMPPIVV